MTDEVVGIVTLPGTTNFGNRLQLYALQEIVRVLTSSTVEAITGLPRRESRSGRVRRLAVTGYSRRHELSDAFRSRSASNRRADLHVVPPLREQAIREFSKEFIASAPMDLPARSEERVKFGRRYRRIIVGSDQVWNPAFTHANPEWFLSFAAPQQRVAYAASIGVPEIPTYLRRTYRRGLLAIPHLTVREHESARIVKELTGRDVPVVLDPTLLLDPMDWRALSRTPISLEGAEYVATFLLQSGDTRGGSAVDLSTLLSGATNQGVSVVDLFSPDQPELEAIGPRDFLGSIANSRLLVTDSFHAAVFATIFHTPFLLVPRGKMNSRFETLMKHSGLRNRFLASRSSLEGVEEVDWAAVDESLRGRREESMQLLRDALGDPSSI